MKTKIFTLIGGIALCYAHNSTAAQTDILLYQAPHSYDDKSFRKDGTTTGLYAAYSSTSGYVFEGAVEKTQIDYKFGTDLDQTDITLAFTNNSQGNHSYRLGLHGISTDDKNTDKALTAFAGYRYYHPYDDYYEASLYYTGYPDNNTDKQVWQIVPKIGKYLGDPITTGTFLLQSKLNLIARETGSSYFSAEAEIYWYYGDVSLNVGVWKGSQLYAVRNDGFIVYNQGDKHTGGQKFEAGYALTDNFSLKAGISQEQITETTGNEVDFSVYTLSLGFTF